jgi:capsular polysaccharide transport system permease protein
MDGLNLPLDRTDSTGSRINQGRISRQHVRPSRLSQWWPLLVFVCLPTLTATGYVTAIESYQYTSEARFVVRTPGQAQPSVHDYILSRDALQELVTNDHLRDLFARPEADFLSRFPNFTTRPTFEHLYKYYLNHVDVDYNSATGLSTLTVNMFRPEDAKLIATALLDASERLVNRLNERARINAVKDSLQEVALAQTKARDIASQIAAFRNHEVMLDPTKQSGSILQGVADLQARLTQTRTHISELALSSPNSPLLAAERRRAAALQGQIDEALTRVAGSDHSMVPKITVYDDLSLQRDFAERELASAIGSLERARVDAQRQQLYLDLIVQPNSADYPAYPRRIRTIAVVFTSCLVLYSLARLLIAAAREHTAR